MLEDCLSFLVDYSAHKAGDRLVWGRSYGIYVYTGILEPEAQGGWSI
jgi:hypothetical protein